MASPHLFLFPSKKQPEVTVNPKCVFLGHAESGSINNPLHSVFPPFLLRLSLLIVRLGLSLCATQTLTNDNLLTSK